MGQYNVNHESREWVRVTDKTERATSIIRRRTLEHHRISGLVGTIFLLIGGLGLIVSMFTSLAPEIKYLAAGTILGAELVAYFYEK